MTSRLRARTVTANGLQFGVLEVGSGPLALCLHGFPDSAHTWRYLLPALADAGFHAVAPFMRGYAPTGIPADGCFQLGALVADAVGLHDALDG
jgi:pimeloyl-ACP methyl ester carboxylesterase